MSTPAAGNEAQFESWNTSVGSTWVRYQTLLDRQIEPLGRLALEALEPRAGERVLDVGCGCGQSSLQLGQAVGPDGRVHGLDVSAPMLAIARQRAAAMPQITFEQADAQVVALAPASWDALYSRFGVMFFADPAAAFSNLRRALRADARLSFVCWRALELNPWMREPLEAAREFLPPIAPSPPHAPGPFAYADAARLAGILASAGFTDVRCRAADAQIGAGDLATCLDVALHVGPLGAALREHPTCAPAVSQAVRTVLARHVRPDGVRMAAAVWVVAARVP